MLDENLDKIIIKAYEAMNQKKYNEALPLFNLAIEGLSQLTTVDYYYSKRLDEITLMAINCKTEIRNDALIKVEKYIGENNIPLIVEYYEIIVKFTKEIGELEDFKKYEEIYERYKEIYDKKENEEINQLVSEANALKTQGELEKSLELYKSALKKAKKINNTDMIESLKEQLETIPIIMLKERRARTLNMAKKAVDDERFLLAMSLYKLASKYSAELEENDKEKEFLLEIKRIEKIKDKFEKQRKKEDTKIEGILEKADQAVEQNNFFEAIKLYQKVIKFRNSISESEGELKSVDYCIEQYFINNFVKNKIPEHIQDVIKIAEEMAKENENFSPVELYQRASKRLLIPKDEISSIIYVLHKIHVLL